MIALPDRSDGLGVVLLNSNADTHFSFTNALGMISSEQMQGTRSPSHSARRHAGSSPSTTMSSNIQKAAKVLSERIGTALVTEVGSSGGAAQAPTAAC